MQGEAGVVGHGGEELLHQFGVVAADFLGWNLEAKAQVGPAGAIEGHLHQGLIQGRHKVAKAVDAAPVGEGLGEGLANGDAHVFVGVVVVDVGVALGADLQIQEPVAGDLVEHVVEEGHAGAHLAAARAIEVELDVHIGFPCDAVNFAGAHG